MVWSDVLPDYELAASISYVLKYFFLDPIHHAVRKHKLSRREVYLEKSPRLRATALFELLADGQHRLDRHSSEPSWKLDPANDSWVEPSPDQVADFWSKPTSVIIFSC